MKIYHHDNLPFIFLPSWSKHQNIRAKRSKYPTPDEDFNGQDHICNHLQSNVPVIQYNPIQSNTIQFESNPNPNTNTNGADAFCVFANEDEELKGLLFEFEQMRTQRGRPMTGQSKQRFLQRLESISKQRDKQVVMLKDAIDNCWLTVYPPKPKPKTTSSNVDDYVEYFNQLIRKNEEADI